MAERIDVRRRNQKSKPTSLAKELARYQADRAEWLTSHEGEFVLIKQDEVVGFFETSDEALAAGYARFGVVPLFVKQVMPDEPIHTLPNIII